MNRNMAVVQISFRMLGRLMNLPEGQEVVHANYDITRDSLMLLIEGAGLPETPRGCPAMEICPHVQEVTRAEFVWPPKG